MRSDVPYHVHIGLEQALIHPRRVVVVQLPEGIVVDELLYLLDLSGEQERSS